MNLHPMIEYCHASQSYWLVVQVNTQFVTDSLGHMPRVPWSEAQCQIEICLKKKIIICEKDMPLLQTLKDLCDAILLLETAKVPVEHT